MTLDEYDRMVKKIRTGCQTKFPVDDSVFDELAANRFPTDPNLMVSGKWLTWIKLELKLLCFCASRFVKCYVNCALQDIGFIRNGNFNVELASKMVKMYVPIEYRDGWLKGFEACQDNKRMADWVSHPRFEHFIMGFHF